MPPRDDKNRGGTCAHCSRLADTLRRGFLGLAPLGAIKSSRIFGLKHQHFPSQQETGVESRLRTGSQCYDFARRGSGSDRQLRHDEGTLAV